MFTSEFFDALGRWQKGWKQDPARRAAIAAALLREAVKLPARFRQHDGTPLYRKRHLYRLEDQRELVPLFLAGVLDERSPTSWSKDYAFAEKFDELFDQHDPNAAAGAIFRHIPSPDEVVLNIPALWDDAGFVAAAEAYRKAGGAEAGAIFHFRGERDQNEVILRAPLRLDEIHALSRPGNFESLCATFGAVNDEAKDAVQSILDKAKITPDSPKLLSPEASRRVVDAVVSKMTARLTAFFAVRTPAKPQGRRGRLRDAFDLGVSAAARDAFFLGWRKLSGPDGLMEGRWSDGTVAYHRPDGAFWIW
jgi:hypothetical protein